MDLDAPIDITIGPYETYNDEIFGYKAAFETFLNLRDDEASAKFSALSTHLQEIEDNLPSTRSTAIPSWVRRRRSGW
jgi:hypothetical protein